MVSTTGILHLAMAALVSGVGRAELRLGTARRLMATSLIGEISEMEAHCNVRKNTVDHCMGRRSKDRTLESGHRSKRNRRSDVYQERQVWNNEKSTRSEKNSARWGEFESSNYIIAFPLAI